MWVKFEHNRRVKCELEATRPALSPGFSAVYISTFPALPYRSLLFSLGTLIIHHLCPGGLAVTFVNRRCGHKLGLSKLNYNHSFYQLTIATSTWQVGFENGVCIKQNGRTLVDTALPCQRYKCDLQPRLSRPEPRVISRQGLPHNPIAFSHCRVLEKCKNTLFFFPLLLSLPPSLTFFSEHWKRERERERTSEQESDMERES